MNKGVRDHAAENIQRTDFGQEWQDLVPQDVLTQLAQQLGVQPSSFESALQQAESQIRPQFASDVAQQPGLSGKTLLQAIQGASSSGAPSGGNPNPLLAQIAQELGVTPNALGQPISQGLSSALQTFFSDIAQQLGLQPSQAEQAFADAPSGAPGSTGHHHHHGGGGAGGNEIETPLGLLGANNPNSTETTGNLLNVTA